MKRYLLLFFLCSVVAYSQKIIFQTPIAANSLAKESKISDDLRSTYLSTDYYNQDYFNLKQDLTLKLPDNSTIEAIYQKTFSYSTGTYSAAYSIKNDEYGQLIFSDCDNVITGMYISGQNKKVVFQQTAKSVFAVSEVNDVSFNAKENELDYVVGDEQNKDQNSLMANSDICLAATPVCSGNTRIDVMVVYTVAAKNLWGSTSVANSTITTAISNMNTAFTSSGITNVTFNLVYAGQVTYTESGVFQTDLNALKSSTDGILDEIHTMRTTYGADLVGLVLGSPTATCGLGNLNTVSTNYVNTQAFVVNLYSCVLSNFSLAHEFGHNLGLNHDWYVNQSTAPCSHHHGYVNRTAIINGTSSTTAQRWRTIMAYNNECSDIGISCTRINRWANPSLAYNSEPTGIAIGQTNPSDEVFALRRAACVVAAFKPATLATGEFVNTPFSIYPNPIKSSLTIICDMEIGDVKIYNYLGQFLFSAKEKTINTEALAAGVYFVKVYSQDGKNLGVRKVIKE